MCCKSRECLPKELVVNLILLCRPIFLASLLQSSEEVEKLQQTLRTSQLELQEKQEESSLREEEIYMLSGRLQLAEQQHQHTRDELQAARTELHGENGEDMRQQVRLCCSHVSHTARME